MDFIVLCSNIDIIQNIVFAIFGAFLGFGLSLLYSLIFRPCLEIESAKIEFGIIIIKVKNLSKRFGAINMNIEACALGENITYYFVLDKNEFLILPKQKCINSNLTIKPNERDFKCVNILKSAKCPHEETNDSIIKKITNNDLKLRVRLHANHSLSGFGRALEEIFVYNQKTGNFGKLKQS